MFYPWLLFVTLTACTSAYRLDADFVTPVDLGRYFSITTIEEEPEYQIVSPYVYEKSGRRKRRALEIEDEIKEIKLEAFGEEYHMRVKENRYLIADDLEVVHHHGNGTTERIRLGSKRCYYIGQLISHNMSQVAVSTCKGMTGVITMQQQELYIAPLTDEHAEKYRRRKRDADNPHIIYRRNVDTDIGMDVGEDKQHFCALDNDFYENAKFYQDAVKLSKNKDAFATKKGERKHYINKRDTEEGCKVKFLETRVMVDRDMIQYHGNNVVDYTLTLMNVVAARYAEPSLGTMIYIHIAKLETIQTDYYTDPDGNFLRITSQGEQTVDSLNTYQRNGYIPNEDDPDHWDAVILMTRKDLRDGASNSLLGIAFQRGACDPVRGAALVEDSGLASGQTLAHEIGHMLGMDHDGSGDNTDCPDRQYVMSTSRALGAGAFKWSKCSKRQLNEFLSDPEASSCLNDVPPNIPEHRTNSAQLPGYQLLSADDQCKLLDNVYTGICGPSAQSPEDVCGRLACLHNNGENCFYEVPAAEGTLCGDGKWCISGECVNNRGQFPTSIDGGWSSWGSYGPCSRTCGGGTRTRERCCDNPRPEHGGIACQGRSENVQLCNTQAGPLVSPDAQFHYTGASRDHYDVMAWHTWDGVAVLSVERLDPKGCTTSQQDFAHEQCAATNNEPWRGSYLTWEAYFTDQTEQQLCEFKCLSSSNWVVPRGPFFQDGTRCSADGRNELKKCIKGACLEFGCDNMLGSPYRFDQCRVCNGDGTSCTLQSGSFTEVNPDQSQFTSFLDIPAGATSIKITNTAPIWTSLLALKVSNTNDYIFGNNLQPLTGEHYSNGIFAKYSYTNFDGEVLFMEGPTPVGFTAEVYRARNSAPNIMYTYSVPNGIPSGTELPPPPVDVQQTTKTPTTQATTTRPTTTKATTARPTTTKPTTARSTTTEPTTTQPPATQPAATQSPDVSVRWLPFGFGECSGTCGTAYRTQLVWCVKFSGASASMTSDAECESQPKPETTEPCDNDLPSCGGAVWDVGQFSQCSSDCNGYQGRSVICRPQGYESDLNAPELSDNECPDTKPSSYQICNARLTCLLPGDVNPSITDIPSDINVNTDAGSPDATVSWTTPTASDHTGAPVTLTSNFNPGASFPIGTTTVTYTATDGSNNQATASFDVVVTDSEKPTISDIPDKICANAVNSQTAPVSWTPPTANDNSGEPVTLISDYNPGATFPTGTTKVTYTARDAYGNQATTSFDVVLTDVANFVIFGIPGDVRVNTDRNSPFAYVSWMAPMTNGDSHGSVTLSSNHKPGALFNIGTTTVSYISMDACGNGRAFASFDIVVSDAENPVISTPADISVNTDPGSPNATVILDTPTTSDNSGGSVTLTISYNPRAPSARGASYAFPIGTTTVTYIAHDPYGNVASVSVDVIVTDTEIPIISGIPSTQNVNVDAGTSTAMVSWTPPIARDNSGKIVTLTSNYNPGASFPIGTTAVMYTAIDASNNQAIASFDVVVTDVSSPEPLEYLWASPNWSQCTATCGFGTRTRPVWCVMDKGTHYVIIGEDMCSGLAKPAETETCDLPVCSFP